jgi:hypothetical protein
MKKMLFLNKKSTLNSFSKMFNFSSTKYFSEAPKSHLEQVRERDNNFIEKLKSGSYSDSEYSNILRVVGKLNISERGYQDYVNRITGELPQRLNNMNSLDIRKVISIVLRTPNLRTNENILNLLNKRYHQALQNEGYSKDFLELILNKKNNLPPQMKFWAKYYKLRKTMVDTFNRMTGINIKLY